MPRNTDLAAIKIENKNMSNSTPFEMAVTLGLSATEVMQAAPKAEDIAALPAKMLAMEDVFAQPYLLRMIENQEKRAFMLEKLLVTKSESLKTLKEVYEGIRLEGFGDELFSRIDTLITPDHICYEYRENQELIAAYTVAFTLNLYRESIAMYHLPIQEINKELELLIS